MAGAMRGRRPRPSPMMQGPSGAAGARLAAAMPRLDGADRFCRPGTHGDLAAPPPRASATGAAAGAPAPVLPRDDVREPGAHHRRARAGVGDGRDGRLDHHLATAGAGLLAAGPARVGHPGLRVFQDFFVDIDLPVALTQNDEISVPVAVYNYLPKAQTVKLTLETQPWFELVNDQAEKSLDIGASDIKVVYFRLRAKGIGRHAFTVHARGSQLSDAIKREIEVLPDGEEHRDTWNDRLDGNVSKTVTIPAQAIDGASTIFVKIYPGLLSQAVEGLDSLLRMPCGCFEQTSSVTYPDVLVMDYLKTTKQIKPEIQMKAEQYINVGYQRLLSFEVQGRRLLLVRRRAREQGAHRLRAAGVPRHVPRARGG